MHQGEGGENSEVVVVQQRRKGKSKNGSKKGKGSLRRRVTFILTSPVHVFRRYVLRKRPKRYSDKEDEDKCDIENVAEVEAVETAKQRKLPCYLLFLGLQQSGKSTTISKLFNGKRPTPKESVHDRSIKVYTNGSVGQDIGLKVVDTPGLCGSEQHDTEVITALASFLKRDSPHRIPTVTFIVARLDDDDRLGESETEQSQFCRMLKSLSQAENLITNQVYSNLVLLLTHSQKAIDILARISKYQNEFAMAFPLTNPIKVIAIDNIRYHSKDVNKSQSYHDIMFEGLKDFAGKRHEHSLNALMNWFTGETKRFSISFHQEILALGSFSEDCCATLKDHFRMPQDCEPYFVMHHTDKKVKRRKSKRKDKVPTSHQMLTCIPPGSQIVLADKSLISIDKCLVGDKLLGFQGASSVITGIRKTSVDDVALEGKSVGNIYCCAIPPIPNDVKEEKVNSSFIYVYTNDVFELMDASKANVPEKPCTENVYFLELDSPNGTLVVNGFPCFARISNSLNNSSAQDQ